MSTISRRPIRMRDQAWAHATARWLAFRAIRPNQISVASFVFAASAGALLAASPYVIGIAHAVLLVSAAASVFLRLMCNLFDGMVAIEGGQSTKSGEIFNDFPDRPADLVILLGAGLAAPGYPLAVHVGWFAGSLALMTAYVRYLGGATGAGQMFLGPMAKQHRMAALIAACVLSAALDPFLVPTGVAPAGLLIYGALVVIIVGEVATIVRRLRRIVGALEDRP